MRIHVNARVCFAQHSGTWTCDAYICCCNCRTGPAIASEANACATRRNPTPDRAPRMKVPMPVGQVSQQVTDVPAATAPDPGMPQVAGPLQSMARMAPRQSKRQIRRFASKPTVQSETPQEATASTPQVPPQNVTQVDQTVANVVAQGLQEQHIAQGSPGGPDMSVEYQQMINAFTLQQNQCQLQVQQLQRMGVTAKPSPMLQPFGHTPKYGQYAAEKSTRTHPSPAGLPAEDFPMSKSAQRIPKVVKSGPCAVHEQPGLSGLVAQSPRASEVSSSPQKLPTPPDQELDWSPARAVLVQAVQKQ